MLVLSYSQPLLLRAHPVLSRDGNGRTSRLIASIPLVMAGYPPININLRLQQEYYTAIRRVFHIHLNEGTFSSYYLVGPRRRSWPFIQCLLDGMRTTMESVQAAFKIWSNGDTSVLLLLILL